MEIKIQVPNPDDYQGNHLEWFAQMRNVLKATEKIYQQEISNLTEEQRDEIYCDFVIDYPQDKDDLQTFMEYRKFQECLNLRIASL